MLLYQVVSTVAACIAVVNAAPATSPMTLHEKRAAPASDWAKGARVERDAILPMRIGLTQTNLEKGYDYLMEVSDPTSENVSTSFHREDKSC